VDDYKALAVCWDWTVSTGVHNPLKKGVIVFSSIHYYFLPYSNFYMQFIKEKKTPKKENKNFYKKTRQKKSYKKTRQKKSYKKSSTQTRTRARKQARKHALVSSFPIFFFVATFLYECVFSCVFSCTSSFLRGRFLAYEFLFPCFRVCFMHESFFAWMLSCTIYFFCVFSLFLVITCHYLAGVKEKLLDDEDHEALMDPSIIKQHSKFLVNLMRSYFGGH